MLFISIILLSCATPSYLPREHKIGEVEYFDLEDLNKVDIQMYKALLVKNTGDEKYTEMPLEDFLIESQIR